MTVENVICAIIFILILGVVFFLCLFLAWEILVEPILEQTLKKTSNKIQWRCEETYKSREQRQNKKKDSHTCNISYRIIPSELGTFAKIYSNNNWETVFEDQEFMYEYQFKEFVKNFKTVGDIRSYLDKECGILWYEP